MTSYTYYHDLAGRIRITEEEGAITEICFANGENRVCCLKESGEQGSALLDKAYGQIAEYLDGRREEFTFPIRMKGTPFQEEVWCALLDIPYGETRTYSEIAAAVGRPKACRAVGMANNRNRLPIVIPCHRVIGSDGRMVGYAGGIELKKKLLGIERARRARQNLVR